VDRVLQLGGNAPQGQAPSKDGTAEKRSLTPVILFAASPGTITGVITLAVAQAKLALPVTALVAIVVATVVMWVVMVLVADGSRARGTGGLPHDMVTRFMGPDCPCDGRPVRADRNP
jgi:multiple antibiotic resistance protein